jgi:hypothetical protein
MGDTDIPGESKRVCRLDERVNVADYLPVIKSAFVVSNDAGTSATVKALLLLYHFKENGSGSFFTDVSRDIAHIISYPPLVAKIGAKDYTPAPILNIKA